MSIARDHRALDYLEAVFKTAVYDHPSAGRTDSRVRDANAREFALLVQRDIQADGGKLVISEQAVRRVQRRADQIDERAWAQQTSSAKSGSDKPKIKKKNQGEKKMTMKELIALERGQ